MSPTLQLRPICMITIGFSAEICQEARARSRADEQHGRGPLIMQQKQAFADWELTRHRQHRQVWENVSVIIQRPNWRMSGVSTYRSPWPTFPTPFPRPPVMPPTASPYFAGQSRSILISCPVSFNVRVLDRLRRQFRPNWTRVSFTSFSNSE